MLLQSVLGFFPAGPLGRSPLVIPKFRFEFSLDNLPGGTPDAPDELFPGSKPLCTQVAGERDFPWKM